MNMRVPVSVFRGWCLRWLLALLLFSPLCFGTAKATNAAEAVKPSAPPATAAAQTTPFRTGWDNDRYGVFPRALLEDGRERVWVATEDRGILLLDGQGGIADWITPAAGLPRDSVTALTIDAAGRVWAGHGRSGVSVFNGKQWKTYDYQSGPLSARVWDLCATPTDVWLATSRGLARYHLAGDVWQYFTAANGFPASVVLSVVAAQDGTIYAGTACDGVFYAQPPAGKEQLPSCDWQAVPVQDTPAYRATGSGLPSRMITALAVAPDGTVYVATFRGLAYGRRGDFQYVRGKDLPRYLAGMRDASAASAAATALSEKDLRLNEDYVSSVTVDQDGRLYLGHRDSGWEAVGSAPHFASLSRPTPVNQSYGTTKLVKTILPMAGDRGLVALYGRGVQAISTISGSRLYRPYSASLTQVEQPFPSACPPLGAAQVAALVAQAEQQPKLEEGAAVQADEDWQTQGNWMGRYGRQLAWLMPYEKLCWQPANRDLRFNFWSGLDFGDSTRGVCRMWMSFLSSEDERFLYNPMRMTRQEGSFNGMDKLPPTYYAQGDNLHLRMRIPAGEYHCGMFFCNGNCAFSFDSMRDISLKLYQTKGRLLAQERVYDFQEGVYKNFYLRGPGDYELVLERGNAFNIMICGLFLSPVRIGLQNGVQQSRWDGRVPWCSTLRFRPAVVPGTDRAPSFALWQKHLQTLDRSGWGAVAGVANVFLLRRARAEQAAPQWQEQLRWQAGLWNAEDSAIMQKRLDQLLIRKASLNPELTR